MHALVQTMQKHYGTKYWYGWGWLLVLSACSQPQFLLELLLQGIVLEACCLVSGTGIWCSGSLPGLEPVAQVSSMGWEDRYKSS